MIRDAERWDELQRLFELVAEVASPSERAAILLDACPDAELRHRVLDLAAALDDDDESQPSRPLVTGDEGENRIGPYRLIELLGAGGVGSVFLAERTLAISIRQHVALKILAPHAAGPGFMDRFEREQQILARLDHPNITRLLDAGVTASGQQYLVMEYVRGQRLDEYCDTRRLTVEQRLDLFAHILAAVDGAHRSLVLHLDLKPSNVLVTENGVVKLLDFGTAKLIRTGTSDATVTSSVRMLTPRYASPEQLQGKPMTKASDVYSLGVVLYELVLGADPFAPPGGADGRTVSPNEPGAAVSEEAAGLRGTSKPRLIDTAAGELWKVMRKALEADPRDRYPSVEAFAEDLKRYSSGKRVLAQAPFRPVSRRFWAGVAVAATLILVAVGALIWRAKGTAEPHSPPFLAVLPFSGDPGGATPAYFRDGLTDEVTNALSDSKSLVLIGRASAFAFRNHTASVQQVGAALHATHLLEGSAERKDGRVRATIRLESANDGRAILSKSYDRPVEELSLLSRDVARDAAQALGVRLERRLSADLSRSHEVLEAVQRARFEADQFTQEGFAKADADARRAIELEPGYAPAYALLGAVTINRASNTVRDLEGHRKVVREGMAYYRKALELAPDLVAPRVSMAGLRLQEDWDWASAEAAYRRALANGPNPVADTYYGLMLVYQHRFQEADEHFALAQERNGYATNQLINLATARVLERRFDDAEQIVRTVLARGPLASARSTLAWINVSRGKPDLALDEYQRDTAALDTPIGKMRRAQALARMGRRKEALALIGPMEAGYRTLLPATSFAAVYAGLQDVPRAMEWLERGASDHDFAVLYLGVAPEFDSLRGELVFQDLLKRVGLAK